MNFDFDSNPHPPKAPPVFFALALVTLTLVIFSGIEALILSSPPIKAPPGSYLSSINLRNFR